MYKLIKLFDCTNDCFI